LPEGPWDRLAAEALGSPVAAWRDASRDHGEAWVAVATGADERRVVLKIHRTADKHRREVAAYRRWGHALLPEAPRLLANREEAPAAIVLSHLPGRTDLPDDDPAAPAVHRAAGAWLARLHRQSAAGLDALPLDVAYRRRADGWLARAADHLDATTLDRAAAATDDAVPRLAGRERVPCHRDFTPRNWLVERGRFVAAIDLEHARADVPEIDLVRLATATWPERPELLRAFLEGYRRAGGPADPAAPWLPGLLVLEAVATVAWAAEHGDAAFEARGRRALARCLAAPR
jgi:aminoglycoside/choline kinase family phosphotransferase